jgi:hypothetical protein
MQGLAICFSLPFPAESTRKIENQTRHKNNADCTTAEHRAAKEKSPGNEQKGQQK